MAVRPRPSASRSDAPATVLPNCRDAHVTAFNQLPGNWVFWPVPAAADTEASGRFGES
jgi:hypothetical protein